MLLLRLRVSQPKQYLATSMVAARDTCLKIRLTLASQRPQETIFLKQLCPGFSQLCCQPVAKEPLKHLALTVP